MLTKRMVLLLPLILFLGLLVFLWRGLGENPHILPSALINKKVPTFSYPSLFDHNKSITNKQFIGHVSLLNVWASWCQYCRAEHAVLMTIALSKHVKIYGINYKDTRQHALAWLKQNGDPYVNVIYDPQGSLGIDFGVYGTPETFIIDQRGIIRYRYLGPITLTRWRRELLPNVQKLAS